MSGDLVTCPKGHQVAADQVQILEGRRICPQCAEESSWGTPRRRLQWSRRLLALPIAVLSLAFLLGAISNIFQLAAYHDQDAPGKLQVAIAVSLGGDFFFLVAVVWVAVVLYRAE